MMDMKGRLTTYKAAMEFILAGRATFTLRSKATGNRFTYKVTKVKNSDTLYFVSLMNGPDNETNYQYLGLIRRKGGVYAYERGRKSRISADAPSHRAFAWFWQNIAAAQAMPERVECWHEGTCGRCNRTLTVPESIERGIGPECIKHFSSPRF